MMNRICGGENTTSKNKCRLEALAASRERELGPDTDSDQEEEEGEGGGPGKAKAARKLSRSVPYKGKPVTYSIKWVVRPS
jgi:hypothetical protein